MPRSIAVEFARFSARSITLVVEFVGADKDILATETIYLDNLPLLGMPVEAVKRTLPANEEWLAASTPRGWNGVPIWKLGNKTLTHRGALFFPNWLYIENSHTTNAFPQSLQLQFAPLVASESLEATHEVRLRIESREQDINVVYYPRLVGRPPNQGVLGAPGEVVTLKARDKKD